MLLPDLTVRQFKGILVTGVLPKPKTRDDKPQTFSLCRLERMEKLLTKLANSKGMGKTLSMKP